MFATGMALVCLSPVAMGQDTIKLSLSKAIEIALSENPTIKVAEKEIQRVNYSKKERLGGLLPNVSLSGTYQRALKKQKMYLDGFNMSNMFSPVLSYALEQTIIQNPPTPSVIEAQEAYEQAANSGDGSIEVGRDNTFTAGLNATLPIIAPSLWATLHLSEMELEMSQESARSSKISLYNQVTKTYYSILMMQDSYDVIKRSYENTLENAKIILNKYKQGTVSEYEWIRADVQVKSAQSNLVSAESAVQISKLQLKMLLGIDSYNEISVEGKLSDFESTMYGDVMKIDTTTMQNNSDLKQFDIQKKQLEQNEKIHKASLLPTLSTSINYQYMSMANDDITFSKDQVWFPTSSLGVTLAVPLFQGGAKYYKGKQIKLQLSELNDQRENLKRSIETQVLSSIENIKKSLKKIESNKDGVRQAEKALNISQKMYEVGVATYLDLSNAELAYVNAGLTYNQSIYDYLSAKADLEKLLGKEFNK
jgi:outer membrane protein TolC